MVDLFLRLVAGLVGIVTRRKASVQAAKLRAYFKAGTCSRCSVSIVWTRTGLCRRCRPVVQEERESAAAEAAEAVAATLHFRYYLTVRKKDPSDIGCLARAFLADREAKRLVGLDAIAMGTKPEEINVLILEKAWAASELERLAVRD